jgi:uncharacterized protein YdeI (YjbR/CyaY-like superfamily)
VCPSVRGWRKEAGIELGDLLQIELEADDEPRLVELPVELQAALAASPTARAAFESLAFTHRKEYAGWIDEAKRDETRQRRAARAVELLTSGTKTPK